MPNPGFLALYFSELVRSEERFCLMSDTGIVQEDLKLVSFDVAGPVPAIQVEDTDGDEVVVFLNHVLSITPLVDYDDDDTDGEEIGDEEDDFDEENLDQGARVAE